MHLTTRAQREAKLGAEMNDDEGNLNIYTEDGVDFYAIYDSTILSVYMKPVSTFFNRFIVWEGRNDLGYRSGYIQVSEHCKVPLAEWDEEDSVEVDFNFPDDLPAAVLLVDKVIYEMARYSPL